MKKFDIPDHYRSSVISRLKEFRKNSDPRKKNFKPTALDFGPVKFLIARHFGFCYGVENAIEIVYKTLAENPGKNIFLLSEMIHNPVVNSDLAQRGVKFVMDTLGNQIINWDEIGPDDIVVIPAFGTTIEIENLLEAKGVDTVKYNTTCPFVEKVWNKSRSLGNENYTVVIHGKAKHEETRATFSHSISNAPAIVIRDLGEAERLADVITGKSGQDFFYDFFKGKFSAGFDPEKDLNRIGVVNQTTMLASETQAIADYLKEAMIQKYGAENIGNHFADTRDTLCYATNDNQSATLGLLDEDADLALVIGGYNSSNTTHLAELLEQKFPTYFISGEDKIISKKKISHFEYKSKKEKITENYLPDKEKITIALTSGASCPDSIVDAAINTILSFFDEAKTIDSVIENLESAEK